MALNLIKPERYKSLILHIIYVIVVFLLINLVQIHIPGLSAQKIPPKNSETGTPGIGISPIKAGITETDRIASNVDDSIVHVLYPYPDQSKKTGRSKSRLLKMTMIGGKVIYDKHYLTANVILTKLVMSRNGFQMISSGNHHGTAGHIELMPLIYQAALKQNATREVR